MTNYEQLFAASNRLVREVEALKNYKYNVSPMAVYNGISHVTEDVKRALEACQLEGGSENVRSSKSE